MLSIAEIAKRLDTRLDARTPNLSGGLTSAEAAERLLRDGPNELLPPPETPEIIKYLRNYIDPFMVLLELAGILSFIAYGLDESQPINLVIGVVLWVVVLLSSTFSYVQEGKASDVMKSFKKLLPRQCHVIRDGRLHDLPASTLVAGDVVMVQGGDQLPADLVMFHVQDLKVELSSLTGESAPIKLAVDGGNVKREESKNLAFSTSQCVEGEGYGVVIATGARTMIGEIANKASATDAHDTPIQKEIKMFVSRLTVFAFCMGVTFFVIGVVRKQKLIDAFINGFIVVMIANVPEGLPMTVSQALVLVEPLTARYGAVLKAGYGLLCVCRW